jgi:hypothetical protein
MLITAMKTERDPLASHIFVSRRQFRTANDTKRREVAARLSFNAARELGFRASFDEWESLMGGGRPLSSADKLDDFGMHRCALDRT